MSELAHHYIKENYFLSILCLFVFLVFEGLGFWGEGGSRAGFGVVFVGFFYYYS